MTDGAKADRDSTTPGTGTEQRVRSKRGIYWILAGLIVTGILAGYNWLRQLPRD